MQTKFILQALIFLYSYCLLTVSAQAGLEFNRIDLNDTLPFNESSVFSLAQFEGRVLAGCGGKRAHLISINPESREVRILRSWPEQGRVRDLIVRGNSFWAVVGRNPDDIVPDNESIKNEKLVSGKIERDQVVSLTVHDAPVAGEGIATVAADAEAENLFVVTRPAPVLFRYETDSNEYERLGELGRRPSFERALTWDTPLERVSSAPQTLAVIREKVYGFFDGAMFYWSEEDGLTTTRLSVPVASDRRRTVGSRVESLAVMGDEIIYGGTYDGYLFRVDLPEERIVNLGKPFRQGNIRALSKKDAEVLLGLCGQERYYRSRLFSYSESAGYREMFAGENLGAMLVKADGTICIGTRGRMSTLYISRGAD